MFLFIPLSKACPTRSPLAIISVTVQQTVKSDKHWCTSSVQLQLEWQISPTMQLISRICTFLSLLKGGTSSPTSWIIYILAYDGRIPVLQPWKMSVIYDLNTKKIELGGFNKRWMDNKRKAIPPLMPAKYGRSLHFIVFHCLLNTHNSELKHQSIVPLLQFSAQIFKTKNSTINSIEFSCLDFRLSDFLQALFLFKFSIHVGKSVLESRCLLYIQKIKSSFHLSQTFTLGPDCHNIQLSKCKFSLEHFLIYSGNRRKA